MYAEGKLVLAIDVNTTIAILNLICIMSAE